MNSPASPTVTNSATRARPLVWLAWLIILAALAWFVVRNVPRYFVVTPESYGDYFWPKVSWLLPHVVGGLFALVIGPLQFWPRIRRDYLQFHRISGRVYVVTVLVGAIAALGLASTIGADYAAYALGLTGLALAWLITTSMAFVAIRRKNIAQHKQWMIRSYVVTFAFVTFRIGDDWMNNSGIMSDQQRLAFLAWGCWAVPLLLTEVVLQSKAVFGRCA